MNLKKNLKAQASLEYFIIFAVIVSLTLLSLSSFLKDVRNSAQNLFSEAVRRILK
jgi:uncharacterized protein (UPF0333 family)